MLKNCLYCVDGISPREIKIPVQIIFDISLNKNAVQGTSDSVSATEGLSAHLQEKWETLLYVM